MIEWDDLRFVLAVARAGSALRAAHALGVNQTTVIRRIAHIEGAVGVDLFEHKQKGYSPTPLARHIATAAARIEDEVIALESAIRAGERLIAASVRVTAAEGGANHLVAPFLTQFRKQHPGIIIDLIVDDRRLDIARGDADVAVRSGSRPEGAGIVARRLPDVAWSVYCGHAYVVERGVPATIEALDGHAVISVEGKMANFPGPLWLARMTPNSTIRTRISARSNSLTNVIPALKAGLGVATLPCVMADADPDLVRCLPPIAELNSELWLVVREALKSMPHIRAFVDALAEHIKGLRAPLAGLSRAGPAQA